MLKYKGAFMDKFPKIFDSAEVLRNQLHIQTYKMISAKTKENKYLHTV